ncbi:hypothetical protein D9758_012123 [Tetrapyrgos nigripes]|uniref:Transcription factor TFIIIC triple barrel domain-containing protein n=1 Tax=Tetrapyrgos nigripes TaxID=182062 RepID=A0A8H5CLH6_9AGAR|nr:hypothetical protein D9758_012123 [Tetrapyrgos nigripes]
MAQPEPQPVPSTSGLPSVSPQLSSIDPSLTSQTGSQLPSLPASDVPFDQIPAEVVVNEIPTTQEPFVVQPQPQPAPPQANGQNGHPFDPSGLPTTGFAASNMTSPVTPTVSGWNHTVSTDDRTKTTLVPGYKHVEEFGPNEEYEDEEEVIYMTFDLGNIEPTLIPSSKEYRVIGLDTPNPFLQLSGTILKGRHESLLGTELLFTEVKDDEDPSKRHLSFVSTNEQRVHFKEVTLVPKRPGASSLTSGHNNNGAASTAKGKGKAKEGSVEGSTTGEASDIGMLNRMTGKDQPAKRTRRASTKGKEKEKATPRRSSRKSKGKQKQVEAEDEDGEEHYDAMDVDQE